MSGATRTTTARAVAYEVLQRIDHEGAYANLVLGPHLERSGLDDRERRFATDLVYGTTRMRRACDALVDRFLRSEPEPAVRTLLRLGAYQTAFGGVPAHAAVDRTVAMAPHRARGFVNAVMRRVTTTAITWPSDAVRLSYPDWIADRLIGELGRADALATMEQMNEAPGVSERADGYVQDIGSQWVAAAVPCHPGDFVLDACAAPGGKATAIAARGAVVVAADLQPHRAALVSENAARLGAADVLTCVADAAVPPFPAEGFDHVLVDAPCSGLGTLRRRADARWRITATDVPELADLQRRIIEASAALVRPGGTLTYSVCTLLAEESVDHPLPAGFDVITDRPDGQWRAFGHGWRVLPHDAGTDGMVVLRYRRHA